jgi:hypothetical protein
VRPILSSVLLGLVVASIPTTIRADVITLNAIDSGWTRVTGHHIAANENYFLGSDGSEETRNWFLFDLSSVADTIVSAELRLHFPFYGSDDSSEDVGLFDVLTPAATLTTGTPIGSPAGQAVFADLGTGVQYGQRTVTPADAGTTLIFTLNANALAALNSATSTWAVGGRMLSWDPDVDVESLFGGTSSGSLRQLVLNAESVPEPSSFALMGLAGLAAFARHRRRGTQSQ